MRSSVSKCAEQAKKASETLDHATIFDPHYSVGFLVIAI
jgi:hypothetical protein